MDAAAERDESASLLPLQRKYLANGRKMGQMVNLLFKIGESKIRGYEPSKLDVGSMDTMLSTFVVDEMSSESLKDRLESCFLQK